MEMVLRGRKPDLGSADKTIKGCLQHPKGKRISITYCRLLKRIHRFG